MQASVSRISGPFWRLDNYDESFPFFDNQKLAADSPVLNTAGWEPSISVVGAFGIFQHVQLFTSPDGVNFLFALDATAPALWGRNDTKFPAYAMKVSILPVPSGIAGIDVLGVSDANGTGNGTLTFTKATNSVSWTAPTVISSPVITPPAGQLSARGLLPSATPSPGNTAQAAALGLQGRPPILSFAMGGGPIPDPNFPNKTITVRINSFPAADASVTFATAPASIGAYFHAEKRHR